MRTNKLDNKLVKLQLLNCIENSKLYIDFLNVKIDFYNKQIGLLNINNILLHSYEEKIMDYYNKINNELNIILKLYNDINDKDA